MEGEGFNCGGERVEKELERLVQSTMVKLVWSKESNIALTMSMHGPVKCWSHCTIDGEGLECTEIANGCVRIVMCTPLTLSLGPTHFFHSFELSPSKFPIEPIEDRARKI